LIFLNYVINGVLQMGMRLIKSTDIDDIERLVKEYQIIRRMLDKFDLSKEDIKTKATELNYRFNSTLKENEI